MNNNMKHIGVLIIGPILLSLTWQPNAQPSQNVTKTDSLSIVQKTTHPIFQKIETADSIQSKPRNLLFTPKDKKHIIIRDLLLRPQDRQAIMIHPVQDSLAQPDSIKQEQ